MSNEISIIPLVDILSGQLGEVVVMRGSDYVFFGNKNIVGAEAVSTALETQQFESDKQIEIQAKKEAQAYLISTDFYMTVDKYKQLTEEKIVELETKREEAREVIRC